MDERTERITWLAFVLWRSRKKAIVDSDVLQQAKTSPISISLDFKDSENVAINVCGENFDISNNGKLYAFDEGLNSGKLVVFVPSAQSELEVMRFDRTEGTLCAKIGNNLKSVDITAQVSESDFETLYAKGVETKKSMISKGEYNTITTLYTPVSTNWTLAWLILTEHFIQYEQIMEASIRQLE